jgi:hypothetical protein
VPIPEPLRFLEPRETETRKMHALEEYGLMHVKLYEDIARFGEIATTYAYPVKVDGRYVMDPSPIPKFDNPKMHMSAALQLFGAGREKRIYAMPPLPMSSASISRIIPSRSRARKPCALCGAEDVYLDEVVTTTRAAGCSSAPTPILRGPARITGHRGELAEATEAANDDDAKANVLKIEAPACPWRRFYGPHRLHERVLRSLARRSAGHRRRIRLGQDDASAACSGQSPADSGRSLPHARRRLRDLADERGRAPLPDAHRLGLRASEPGRWPAHGGLGRRQCRRAADGGRRAALWQDPRATRRLARARRDRRDRIDDQPRAFSGGMRSACRSPATWSPNPRLVFMDEPTGGLDVSVQARLLDLLRGLVSDLACRPSSSPTTSQWRGCCRTA